MKKKKTIEKSLHLWSYDPSKNKVHCLTAALWTKAISFSRLGAFRACPLHYMGLSCTYMMAGPQKCMTFVTSRFSGQPSDRSVDSIMRSASGQLIVRRVKMITKRYRIAQPTRHGVTLPLWAQIHLLRLHARTISSMEVTQCLTSNLTSQWPYHFYASSDRRFNGIENSKCFDS